HVCKFRRNPGKQTSYFRGPVGQFWKYGRLMTHNGFIPHGYCMQWDVPLIVTYVITDALVALSYYSIPAALFLIAFRKRQAVPVQPLLILFGLFIAFCGGGHAIDIVSLWKPLYC